MSIDEDIAILESVPMLNVLGRATLRLIAMGAETRDVAEGEILFPPNGKVDCAYVIQQGSFLMTADPYREGKTIDAGPGMMIGEYALLSDVAQPLSAIAREPSTVMRISRSMFMKILGDDGDAAVRLRDFVARRARQSVADMLVVRDNLDPRGSR